MLAELVATAPTVSQALLKRTRMVRPWTRVQSTFVKHHVATVAITFRARAFHTSSAYPIKAHLGICSARQKEASSTRPSADGRRETKSRRQAANLPGFVKRRPTVESPPRPAQQYRPTSCLSIPRRDAIFYSGHTHESNCQGLPATMQQRR